MCNLCDKKRIRITSLVVKQGQHDDSVKIFSSFPTSIPMRSTFYIYERDEILVLANHKNAGRKSASVLYTSYCSTYTTRAVRALYICRSADEALRTHTYKPHDNLSEWVACICVFNAGTLCGLRYVRAFDTNTMYAALLMLRLCGAVLIAKLACTERWQHNWKKIEMATVCIDGWTCEFIHN